jgi:hypothetical protein
MRIYISELLQNFHNPLICRYIFHKKMPLSQVAFLGFNLKLVFDSQSNI